MFCATEWCVVVRNHTSWYVLALCNTGSWYRVLAFEWFWAQWNQGVWGLMCWLPSTTSATSDPKILNHGPQANHHPWYIFFLARCCLGQVPGGAPFSQRSKLTTTHDAGEVGFLENMFIQIMTREVRFHENIFIRYPTSCLPKINTK